MDEAITSQFGLDRFATAQMARLDVSTGHLEWVKAGHPTPLLLRDHGVVAELESVTTLPVGFGGATPVISERTLERGDRVLFFTYGVIEEDRATGGGAGETRLRKLIERVGDARRGIATLECL